MQARSQLEFARGAQPIYIIHIYIYTPIYTYVYVYIKFISVGGHRGIFLKSREALPPRPPLATGLKVCTLLGLVSY